jgi:RiboL-PSP-HEPN
MLCAAWERYIETVALEGAIFLTKNLSLYKDLPPNLKTKILGYVNNPKNTWTVADLGTPSWEKIYIEALKRKTESLNTPKHVNLKPLFEDFLDVPDIAGYWGGLHTEVDDFVTLRGEVAHRGGQSQYIKFGKLTKLEWSVTDWVVKTDNGLSNHLNTLVTPNKRPWNRIL